MSGRSHGVARAGNRACLPSCCYPPKCSSGPVSPRDAGWTGCPVAPPASTATRLSLCRLRLAITTLTARCSHPGSSYTGPGAQAHSGPARREPSRGAWMSMGCQLSQGTMECGQGGEHRQGEHCHGRVASQTQGRRHPGTSSAQLSQRIATN